MELPHLADERPYYAGSTKVPLQNREHLLYSGSGFDPGINWLG